MKILNTPKNEEIKLQNDSVQRKKSADSDESEGRVKYEDLDKKDPQIFFKGENIPEHFVQNKIGVHSVRYSKDKHYAIVQNETLVASPSFTNHLQD